MAYKRRTSTAGKKTRMIGDSKFTVTMCSTSKKEAADEAQKIRDKTKKKVRVITQRGNHCVYVGGKSKTATKPKAKKTGTKKKTRRAA